MRTDFIVSDIHLGAVPDATERRFLRFVEHAGEEASALLIAGDLFDFWFEYGPVIHGRHFRVLAALAELVESGVPVTMVGGNHDAWGGSFLRDEVGIRFHDGPLRMRLAGRPALVAHGDGIGRGDLRYRLLRAVIRSRPAILAFRALHPELGVRLARAVSSTEGRLPAESAPGTRSPSEGRSAFLRRWASERLEAEPELFYVVCGHTHSPEILEVEERRYYLNAGDWIRSYSFIRFTPDGRPELRRWE